MSLQHICQVPSGQYENIAQDIKRQLARQMQQRYPQGLFQEIIQFATAEANDGAKQLLLTLWEGFILRYDRDQLLYQCPEGSDL